jgi:hypothetical protein
MSKLLAHFAQTTAKFCEKNDHNLGFFRKTPIFLVKIVKNRRKL